MGTNYYLHFNHCDCCNRFDQIHIGKSSTGWRFTFRGYLDLDELDKVPDVPDQLSVRSFEDWQRIINQDDCEIYDEYGRHHTKESFYNLVKDKRELKSQAAYSISSERHTSYKEDYWHDEYGNSFTGREFT